MSYDLLSKPTTAYQRITKRIVASIPMLRDDFDCNRAALPQSAYDRAKELNAIALAAPPAWDAKITLG